LILGSKVIVIPGSLVILICNKQPKEKRAKKDGAQPIKTTKDRESPLCRFLRRQF
jgi:hypothetical protein